MKRSAAPIGVVLALCASARGQDSVALAPGGNDALSAYGAQRVRYVVDMTPFLSSWGHEYVIGPVLKTSRGVAPGERSSRPMGVAVSRDARLALNFPARDYSLWTTRGAGVHPSENATPGVVQTSMFDEQYAVSLSDLSSAGATNVLSAIVGWSDDEPDRLWVERVIGASSRASSGAMDNAVLSTGACDADGVTHLRADAFGLSTMNAQRVAGENIVRVNSMNRSGAVNTLSFTGAMNAASDASATTYFINNSTTTVAPPNAQPSSAAMSGQGQALTMTYAGGLRVGAGAATMSHLAPALEAVRGNPSYATIWLLSSGGLAASLGMTDEGLGIADSINAWGLTPAGAVSGTLAATLPPVLNAGSFTAIGARFHQHLNQTAFRGGVGHVGVGRTGMDLVFAATALDDVSGEFIAAARFAAPAGNSPATWSLVAYPGKQVLSAENGPAIGVIVEGFNVGSPVTFSAPAVDLLGNVYFIAPFKPTLAPARLALLKAVNTPSGYQLERILEEGQVFVGQNSTRQYVVKSLALGDSNSVSSESFFAGAALHARRPGAGGNPANSDAFGGAAVSAVIEYDNVAVVESYRAVLFIAPKGLDGLVGDINQDGVVNTADLGLMIGAFGSGDAGADLNGDGVVDTADLGLLISHFGQMSG